jgi:hypothetical protein
MFPSPPQFSRTRPPWSVVGKQKCSFFVSWLESAMMKRSGGLRESYSAAISSFTLTKPASPGLKILIRIQERLRPCRLAGGVVGLCLSGFEWTVGCQEQELLATHRPSSILRRQVRVLSGSWALDKLINRFISILPLCSDDGFHIPQIGPPRSSQTTHTMRLHYRVGLLQRPHPR